MAIRKIEVPVLAQNSVDSLLDAACRVAGPFDAQVELRFIRPAAGDAALYDAGFGFASASLIDQIETEGLAAAAAAKRNFDSWCERHPTRPRLVWTEEEGHTGAVVSRRGCLSDLILLQRAGAKDAAIDEPFEAAVYGAGRLAMVVDQTLPADFLDHVMIAWNDSTEASRALAQSLPFLAKAERVSIFTAAEAGGVPADIAELVAYLALHGIAASPLPLAASGSPVGDQLTTRAKDNNVTLLVMGAYTHNRVRQLLFGGVTQHILTTPGLPALLAH